MYYSYNFLLFRHKPWFLAIKRAVNIGIGTYIQLVSFISFGKKNKKKTGQHERSGNITILEIYHVTCIVSIIIYRSALQYIRLDI